MVPPTIANRFAICALLAATALLLACTVGDPKPTPTAVVTPVVTPSPLPSAVPPAALTQSSANAEFVLNITRRDRYVWPAEGPITSYFGTGHPNGIDIALDTGGESAIRAAGDGRVVVAGGDPCCSLGLHIEIEHDGGGKTVYGHLARVDLAEGALVKQGDQLGLGGSTGDADGKHLHFEVYQDGAAVDPFRYLPADQQAKSGS